MPSNRKNKKYKAVLVDTTGSGHNKMVHFGEEGSKVYYNHRNYPRKLRYILRHKSDLQTRNPTMPGYLSMFLLWNKPTLAASKLDYNARLRSGDFSLPK